LALITHSPAHHRALNNKIMTPDKFHKLLKLVKLSTKLNLSYEEIAETIQERYNLTPDQWESLLKMYEANL
jgi:hypothetical protein